MSRSRPRVLLLGAGWRFTSGISYYTCRLANAFAEVGPTSAVLMRQLVPRRMYPGRDRVGLEVNDLAYSPGVAVYDGVDWSWGRSMLGAVRFLRKDPAPEVVVLQWWTGAVLHSYLLLVWLLRRRGARIVMEWHEVQDTGEARVPGAAAYVRSMVGLLLRQVDVHVMHSRFDLEELVRIHGVDPERSRVVPHGPYDHHLPSAAGASVGGSSGGAGDPEPLHLLYFGTIRPYKGVEDLVAAFEQLPEEVSASMTLTIVGETWEGWTSPLEAVEASPVRHRITVVNRYVTDAEVQEHFAAADAVVLPYRRSSASGPLHIAMSSGLPVVVSAVGGLEEAAGGYEGAVFSRPGDVASLREALASLPARRGLRYADPHSWSTSVEAILELAGYRSR